MEVGDNLIISANSVPDDSAYYLSEGKEYKASVVRLVSCTKEPIVELIDDEGDRMETFLFSCPSLDFMAWDYRVIDKEIVFKRLNDWRGYKE